MKRSSFITIFVTVHIVFITLQINKHSQLVKESYKKQKYEKQLLALTQKKRTLTHQLLALQNKPAIKKFAQEKLGMHTVKLTQIKKLEQHEQKL